MNKNHLSCYSGNRRPHYHSGNCRPYKLCTCSLWNWLLCLRFSCESLFCGSIFYFCKLPLNFFKVNFSRNCRLFIRISYCLLTVASKSVKSVAKDSKLRISTTRWGQKSKIALKTPSENSRRIFWCNKNFRKWKFEHPMKPEIDRKWRHTIVQLGI